MTPPRLLSTALVLAAGCVDVPGEEVGTSAGEVSVTWTNLVGVLASGNDLTKTASASAWNAGAVSVEAFAGDGYVELTVGETGTNKAAGLSNDDGNQSYTDIDYALRFTASGAVQVYEDGALRGSFGTYAAGDRFRIEARGGIVRYSRSGETPFYTSAVAPSFTLLVDTALYTPGATLTDVELVATALSWQNLVGVSASDDDVSLTKTSTTAGWNAGASSAITLTGDGFMEFVAADDTTAKAAGLSSGDSNRSFKDIDYCVRLSATGNIQVYEGGVLRGSFGKYLAGDRFRVEVLDGVVSYSTNGGVPFYTSQVAPSLPLGIDTSFYTPGATLNDLALVEEANACPAYAGTGLVCTGTFVVDSPAALAQIAFCARITGDLYLGKTGLAEVSLPFLERIDGVLRVDRDPKMVRLRLPQLKEIGSISYRSVIEVARATGGVDLSRLRWFDSIQTYMRGSLEMSLPCLDTAIAIEARQWNGSRYELGRVHVPRLREVGVPELGYVSAHMTAPRLERVIGGFLDGDIVAPILTTVTRFVDSQVTIDAPNLTDIGGNLGYNDADNLPALQRVGGNVTLQNATSIDLPALVEITGALGGGDCFNVDDDPSAPLLDLPALERVGSMFLCWDSLEQVSLPLLQELTATAIANGFLTIRSTGLTEPVTLPSLSLVRGDVDAQTAMDLPVLTGVQGHMTLNAPVSAPALVSIGRELRPAAYSGAISFPALASVGGINCSNGAATSISLPALTQVANYIQHNSLQLDNCDNLTSISAPLLQSISGYIAIIWNDALTSIDLGSLTALGRPSLSIYQNSDLPNCYATNIRDQLVANGWSGTVTIHDNDGTGACP